MMLKFIDAALVCACASLIINVIAIAVPYWFYAQTKFRWGWLIIYSGLWTTCNQTKTPSGIGPAVCRIVAHNGPHYIAVTSSFELIGLLLVACTVILGLLKFFAVLRDPVFLCIAGGLAAAAGCCMILGAIIFGAKTVALDENRVTLHAGFYFALLSGVFALGGGTMFLACESD